MFVLLLFCFVIILLGARAAMCCLLLLVLWVHSAWGQGAPGDFEFQNCNASRLHREVVLFDSRSYNRAYTSNWIFVRNDGNPDTTRVSS